MFREKELRGKNRFFIHSLLNSIVYHEAISSRLPTLLPFGKALKFYYLGMKRSHHCNQLAKKNAGSSATLIGWIDSSAIMGAYSSLISRPGGQDTGRS